jgi:hypothetical protein
MDYYRGSFGRKILLIPEPRRDATAALFLATTGKKVLKKKKKQS